MRRKFSLAFQLALRELRHGWKHFAVFMVCLTLGVAVIGVVGSFSFTVEEALQGKAQSLLGGDVEVSVRGIGANDVQQEFLGTYGRLSYVSTMRAMLHRDDSVLVELKAIDDAYPLLGKLEFNEPILRQEVFAGRGVAVDAALLSRLSLNLGDEVRLGNAMYTIKATIKFEPDRAVQIFSFGPRVMLSHAALAESGLVNTFSLIQHRYRITTPKNAIVDEKFEERIEDTLRKRFPEISWRVRTGTDGNRTVQRFLDQLLSFLTLSGLATFLIAGIGIGSAVRAYLEKKSQTIAVLKTLGAARVTV